MPLQQFRLMAQLSPGMMWYRKRSWPFAFCASMRRLPLNTIGMWVIASPTVMSTSPAESLRRMPSRSTATANSSVLNMAPSYHPSCFRLTLVRNGLLAPR